MNITIYCRKQLMVMNLIKESIEMFQLDYNHYKNVVRRRMPFGPIVGYSYNGHQASVHISNGRWLSVIFIDGYTNHSKGFGNFVEAYTYLEEQIVKFRLPVLLDIKK
jgi:hypothetical protein